MVSFYGSEPSPRPKESHQRPPNAFGVDLVSGKTGTLQVKVGSNQLKLEFGIAGPTKGVRSGIMFPLETVSPHRGPGRAVRRGPAPTKHRQYLFTGLKPNRIWPSNKGLDKSPRFV